jgi:starch-binding outer membrane protein, SusD/RagB family
MKKIISISLLVMALFSTFSCKEDILDIKNENSYSDATYFKDRPQFNEALVATYATLLQQGMYARDWYFTFDLMGNDAERSIALLGDLQQMSEFNFGTGQPQMAQTWVALYRMVFRANIVVDKLTLWEPTSDENKAYKTQYMAEAKFLRGLAYFNIVSLWGRAPLKKTVKDNQNFYDKRATTAEIWAFVEADFKDASAGLPIKHEASQLGRATKGAAKAMLGKAYLYQKKYAEAETQLASITTGSFGYKLNPSYEAQFTTKNSGSAETIFDIPHRWFGWGTNGANAYYMFGGQEAWGGQTTHSGRFQEYGFNDWNNVYVSDALVKSFKYKDAAGKDYIDPRAKMVVYGDAASGTDTDFCNNCAGGKLAYPFEGSGYKWKKYCGYEDVEKSDIPASDINTQVIRYADVLLMLAEAKIFQGKNADALPLINQVRKRVGAYEYTSLGAQADAIKTLQLERQMELAGEQARYFDQVRWGSYVATINTEKNSVRFKYPSLKENPVQPKHVLWPIPQSEKDTNPTIAKDVKDNWN